MTQIDGRLSTKAPQFNITDDLTTTGAVPYDRSDACIRIISGSVATVTVYGSDLEDGTFRQLRVSGSALGTLSVSTTLDEELPANYFKYGWLKFVGNVAGVAQLVAKA